MYDVLDIEQDLYVYKQQSLAGERERKVALNGECAHTYCSYVLRWDTYVCGFSHKGPSGLCNLYMRMYVPYVCMYCIYVLYVCTVCMYICTVCTYVLYTLVAGQSDCAVVQVFVFLFDDYVCDVLLLLFSLLEMLLFTGFAAYLCAVEEDPIWDTLRHLPINEAAE